MAGLVPAISKHAHMRRLKDMDAGHAVRRVEETGRRYLFRKFSGRPGRDHSIAISSPLPDNVM